MSFAWNCGSLAASDKSATQQRQYHVAPMSAANGQRRVRECLVDQAHELLHVLVAITQVGESRISDPFIARNAAQNLGQSRSELSRPQS